MPNQSAAARDSSFAVIRAAGILSELLWVGGLALVLLLAASRWGEAGREGQEWACYLVLGTLFPALVLLLSWLPRAGATAARAAQVLKGVFAVALLWIAGAFLLGGASPVLLACAAAQAALLLGLALARRGEPAASLRGLKAPADIALLAGGAFVLPLAWTVAGTFVHWRPLGAMITASLYSAGVFALALVVVSLALFRPEAAGASPNLLAAGASPRSAALAWIADLAAVLVIALFAFSLASIFAFKPSFEHWAWAVGPAQLVREGGWLLWDVHATYGFLSTLAIAAFPSGSTWQALYLINATLLLASGVFVFRLFRAACPGVAGFSTALALAVSAVVLMPGHAEVLTGAQVYPSAGPFRFVWCYVLLGILLAAFLRPSSGRTGGSERNGPSERDGRSERTGRSVSRSAWAGSLAWVAGALWSAESAAYCTAIWLPAYAVILWHDREQREPGARLRVGAFVAREAPWLLLPFALLAAAVAGVTAYYRVFLGHAPDFSAFWLAAVAFSSEFNLRPVDLAGNVWVLVLVLVVVASFAALLLAQAGPKLPELSLAAGAFGAVWATSSYFVAKSVPPQVPNLIAVLCASLAILLLALGRSALPRPGPTLLKAALVPLLTVVVFAGFGNGPALASFLSRTQLRYADRTGLLPRVDERIPLADADLRGLLARAGVEPGQRITSLGRDLLGRVRFRDPGGVEVRSEHPALLPIKPTLSLSAISARRERIETLFSRWIARFEPSGWLVVPSDAPRLASWVQEVLGRTHTPGRTFSTPEWKLVWMQFGTEAAE